MMFSQDRMELRQLFFESWRKYQAGEELEPLATLVAEIVKFHPEYHAIIGDPERYADHDWPPEHGETNPFLHLAMHIGIQEQLGTDRPTGFRALYQRLVQKHGHPHEAEHQVMDCLAEGLWRAQRDGQPPDEQAYLHCLRNKLGEDLSQTPSRPILPP